MTKEIDPDLVVVGSEALSTLTAANLAASTSISFALAKMGLSAPLLIVKPNASGDLLRTKKSVEANMMAPGAIKAAFEVGPSSMHMLDWLLRRLTPKRDSLLFFRPRGLGDGVSVNHIGSGQPVSTFTTRLLTSFDGEAKKNGFESSKTILSEGLVESLPPLLVKEKCDLLVLAGGAGVTPQHALELLKTVRASVLIWRQA